MIEKEMEKPECNKKAIRTAIKEKKAAMTEAEIVEKSHCIIGKLLELEAYQQAENIFVYVNYNEEVITSELIRLSLAAGKQVFVPKIFTSPQRLMGFIKIESVRDLKPGYYGILEPEGSFEAATTVREGLLVMPGLAFDMQFHRIGYGGGFYDRYLMGAHAFVKVALAFDFQVLEEIPYEAHDCKPDMIITENQVLC